MNTNMVISSIRLQDFQKHTRLDLDGLQPGINLFTAPNGWGRVLLREQSGRHVWKRTRPAQSNTFVRTTTLALGRRLKSTSLLATNHSD